MKRSFQLFTLIIILLLVVSNPLIVNSAAASTSVELWALIVCGSTGMSFSHNTAYMYHALSEHYSFDGITYLSVYPSDPGVNASATLNNVRSAINTTLASWSDENDIVFIYFSSHGGGYNARHNQLEGGRFEVGGDEGNEVSESTLGLDVNGDGDMNDWVGIDECIQVQNGWYWDDELAADLNNVYGRIVFVRQGCVEGNQSCFGGGLIDDLTAPNRIIMCATNETWYSYGDLDAPGDPGYGYSEWSEAFIDALHGERTYWNATTSEVVHTGINVDADLNDNGHVSMWEAWHYAWNNDEARLSGDETPWFDDDGDGLPTFRNGADNLDNNQGSVANMTYIDWLLGDIDENGTVELADFFFVSQAFGSYPGHDRWDSRCDLNCDEFVELMDFYHMSQNFGKTWSGGSSSGSGKGSSGNGSPLLGSGTTFSVNPSQITVFKDESFSVNITLNDVTDLYGWEYKLFWDNSILNCTNSVVYAPEIWANNTYWAGPGVENNYNATHGSFFKLLIAIYPTPSLNGTTVTATLTFKAIATGTTTLDLQDTKLIDSEGEAISHTAQDGSVTVLLMRITRRPNAVGTYTQFPYQYPASGSHWDKVDEEAPDESSTVVFVSDSTAWYKDCFNIEDITIPGNATIKSVTIYNRVSSLGSGIRAGYHQTLIRTYNTDYFGTTNRPPTTYTPYSTTYTTNPYTGQTWTVEEINALQIGAYAKATYFNGEYWDVYCTQVYIVIDVI